MRPTLSTNALIDNARLCALSESWTLVDADLQLNASGAASRAKSFHGDPGTYLWVFESRLGKYSLYVGKCSNLKNRIYAYTQSFQPHAPNDRKLVFSQIALKSRFSDAVFSLYFKPCGRESINKMETAAIANFSPLLNQRIPHSNEAKQEFEAMYQAFYGRLLGAAFDDA